MMKQVIEQMYVYLPICGQALARDRWRSVRIPGPWGGPRRQGPKSAFFLLFGGGDP